MGSLPGSSCNSPAHGEHPSHTGLVPARGAQELELWCGIPKDAVLGDPLPPFCWALDFPLAWTGQHAAAWATCRMLKAGMEEESSFPRERREGVHLAYARKGCYGCWEVPWGLGLVLGFPLDILIHVLHTIPSLAR